MQWHTFTEFLSATMELAWPVAVALAWIAGELVYRTSGLPRISTYGVVGFLLGQIGVLPQSEDTVMLLANVAFGLILFEAGYRINLNWLRINPWLGVTSAVEAVGTFVAVFFLAQWFGMPTVVALLLASLAMPTSPAGILRIVNESHSAGQVTERALLLSALNCVLGVFAFKVIVGFWLFQSSGSLWQAIWSSLILLAASAGLGALFGVGLPGLLRRLGRLSADVTVAFAIAVILLVALTYILKLSPILATLTFGLVARHRRIVLSQAQRNFGALGDILAVLLFVFITTKLEWQHVVAGLSLGLALVLVRMGAKVTGVLLFARVSGISWRKGALTGMALMPMSVFVILFLEQVHYIGIELPDRLTPLAAATLLLELLGPILTQRAIMAAGESHDTMEH